MDKITRVVKKIKLIIIIYHIFDNYLTKVRYKLGKFETKTGATHTKFKEISGSVEYINKVFNEYFLYSGLPIEYIQGKSILEIGPGDNLGVALKFLVHGASKVVCVDKFYSKRNLQQQSQIYKAMRNELSPDERRIFDSIVKLDDNGLKFVSNKLEYIYGKGIEEVQVNTSFDMVISRAVMEHVYSLDAAFYNMDKILKPGGYMIHNIDFKDHGLFTSAGMHPLTFLTISDRIWDLMTKDSGKPNRMLIGYYKKKMNELNYEFKIAGIQYIESLNMRLIRPKLHSTFRNLSDEDLIIASVFLIAKKR